MANSATARKFCLARNARTTIKETASTGEEKNALLADVKPKQGAARPRR